MVEVAERVVKYRMDVLALQEVIWCMVMGGWTKRITPYFTVGQKKEMGSVG